MAKYNTYKYLETSTQRGYSTVNGCLQQQIHFRLHSKCSSRFASWLSGYTTDWTLRPWILYRNLIQVFWGKLIRPNNGSFLTERYWVAVSTAWCWYSSRKGSLRLHTSTKAFIQIIFFFFKPNEFERSVIFMLAPVLYIKYRGTGHKTSLVEVTTQ